MEDERTTSELMNALLSTAESMHAFEDELDRVSLHSHSNSRESLHSSTKYDSAFDSHYSEDAASLDSQQVHSILYPVDINTDVLPSLLTPPLQYRVPETERSRATTQEPAAERQRRGEARPKREKQQQRAKRTATQDTNSPSPLVTHSARGTDSGTPPVRGEPQPSPSAESHSSDSYKNVSHLMLSSSLPTVHQPEHIYLGGGEEEEEEAKELSPSSTPVFSV